MPTESILCINLRPEDQQYMEQLLLQLDTEVVARYIAVGDEAEAYLAHENLCLVVLRIDEQLKRPDQHIRRLKRSFRHPLPLFLLVPPTLSSKIKSYLHAGADDFWILPLDEVAFANRFYIVLEWGQAMVRGESYPFRKDSFAGPTIGSLGRRVWGLLKRWFSSGPSTHEVARNSRSTSIIAGKWEKIRRLGFGSFGEVWLVKAAIGTAESALAVAKIPHDQRMNTKFMREAAILRRLAGHPNAVHLKEIVREEGRVVLVQEYVAGRSLHEHFEQGLDAIAKERAFVQLLAVMAYAHQQKIMHRDIKPENIIISPAGVLKLLDFGTAKDLTRRSVSNTVIGSRPYMAPEQILGKSRLASDVWALGVILYALATECLPFYDDNEKLLMDLILEVEPAPPRSLVPELPEEIEVIITNCLQKDPSQRYRDAMELRDALAKMLPDFGNGAVLPGS